MRTEEELSSGAGSSGPLPYAQPTAPTGNGRARRSSESHSDARRQSTFAGARSAHDDPTLGHAVSHSFTAAKRMVADRLALMRVEVQQSAGRLLGGGVLLAIGTVVLVLAWFALAVGAVLTMGVWWGATLSLPIRLLIVTGATAALGGALLAAGLSAMRRPHDAADADHERAPRGAAVPYATGDTRAL